MYSETIGTLKVSIMLQMASVEECLCSEVPLCMYYTWQGFF